jgi:hypothetical protein
MTGRDQPLRLGVLISVLAPLDEELALDWIPAVYPVAGLGWVKVDQDLSLAAVEPEVE